MTVSGRKRTFANGENRPISVIHAGQRERLLPDRKADIAYGEIIVRRSNQFDCLLSQTQADVWSGVPGGLSLANSRNYSPLALSSQASRHYLIIR